MKCILYKYVANSVKELTEILLYIQKSNIKTTLNNEENTVVFAGFLKISCELLPVNWCVWYSTLTFHLYLKSESKITFQ